MRPGLYERHHELLRDVLAALAAGSCRRPFTDATGQASADAGMRSTRTAAKVFHSLLGRPFELGQPGELGLACTESSPYGIRLDIAHPCCDPAMLVAAAGREAAGWRAAGPYERAGLAVEILRRLNTRSHELALAVHHTTGQPLGAALRAAGPRTQDRALETVARAYAESGQVPADGYRDGAGPGGPRLSPRGTSTLAPRGVSLLVGCPDFPLWNGYPGLFASLVTGNPVVVAPHPRSVLPLAITVRVARQTLAEAGHDPDVVTLAVAEPERRVHRRLAADPAVRIVDFTGPGRFADWLERNAHQAAVFANRTGPGAVVVDSTDNYRGLVRSLALACCLCSGMVRTTPQNILVPEAGFATDEGHRTPRDLGADIGDAVDRLLAHPARVARLLGAITTEKVREALAKAMLQGPVLHASAPVPHPDHPDADVRSPLLVRLRASHAQVYTREWPGPVSFLVGTDSTSHSLALLRTLVARHGAPYASVHSTDPLVLAAAETAALDAGVHLMENLDDLPADPSSDLAELPGADAHFVTGRFRVVRARRRTPSAAAATVPGPLVVPVPDRGPAAGLVNV